MIPLPKTKANPITHPQALFQKDQVSGKPPLTRLRTGEPLPPPPPPQTKKKINVQVCFCPIIMCKRNRVYKCRVFMSASQHFFFLSLSFFFGGGGGGAAKGKFAQFTWVVFLVDCDGAVSSNYVFLQSRYPRTTNKGT